MGLREIVSGATSQIFNGKQVTERLVATRAPQLLSGLRDGQLSLGELAKKEGTSINSIRKAFLQLIAQGEMTQEEYESLMARNSSLSQVKRSDLKGHPKKEKPLKHPRQTIPKEIAPTRETPPNRPPKEKTPRPHPQRDYLEGLLNGARTYDTDQLVIQMRFKFPGANISRARVQQLRGEIYELRRNKPQT
jgi:hypothetical protein